jgi:hypothetical protein
MVGWRAYQVEGYVTWCGHAQEVIPWPKLTARAGPRRGALAGDPTMTITIDLAETACEAALDSPVEGPDSATRAAIERAPRTTAGSKIRRVTCTLAEAKDMLEYFEHAASRLQVRGEYEKSTACAQALEGIRRALQR